MQVQLSSVGFTTINDPVTAINGVPMPQNTYAASLPTLFPQTFFFEQNTLGQSRVCCARIDGQPLTIEAIDGVTPYNPVVENYSILFPFGIKTHPEHRPK
jgi:hypothetical protein